MRQCAHLSACIFFLFFFFFFFFFFWLIAYEWGRNPLLHTKFVACRINVRTFEVTPKLREDVLLGFFHSLCFFFLSFSRRILLCTLITTDFIEFQTNEYVSQRDHFITIILFFYFFICWLPAFRMPGIYQVLGGAVHSSEMRRSSVEQVWSGHVQWWKEQVWC